MAQSAAVHVVVELPPRARRIRSYPAAVGVATGTTSACAENTWYLALGVAGSGNYLRVRGEYGELSTF